MDHRDNGAAQEPVHSGEDDRLAERLCAALRSGHDEANRTKFLGIVIRDRRKELNLTRNQLAMKTGLDRSQLVLIENGILERGEIIQQTLHAIADHLRLPRKALEILADLTPGDIAAELEMALRQDTAREERATRQEPACRDRYTRHTRHRGREKPTQREEHMENSVSDAWTHGA
jgi:transcriptional regulator with XRE-family HTH domain